MQGKRNWTEVNKRRKRDKMLCVMVTEEEREQLKAKAKEQGKTLLELVLSLL